MTTTCADRHDQYAGKCPYCHETLPSVAERTAQMEARAGNAQIDLRQGIALAKAAVENAGITLHPRLQRLRD